MFTGLVTGIGTVEAVKGGRVTLALPKKFAAPALGASVACDGVCLTVVKKGKRFIKVDVSPETLKRTAIGQWKKGAPVNLEPALKVGDELGGHLVTGHVDGVATLKTITKKGAHSVWEIGYPKALAPFIAEKGSVTLDGVSLTVNAVKGDRFFVNIIPHTLKHTNFAAKKAGSAFNLEVDIVARYLMRQRSA